MRILHLDAGRGMRGGQWQVLRLLEGLAAGGNEGTLLAPRQSPLLEKASRRGLQAEPLGLGSVMRLSRDCDLIHAHDARSHTLAAFLSKSPLVVARRVAFPIRQGPASRWKYGRAAHYIAVSQFVRQSLVARGIAPERISVVYDGVPLPAGAEAGDRILAPATDDPRKGSALVREAARLAGIPIHFSPSLETELPGAGLFVYISDSEGLGSAVLMAMAAGVPVVASNVGGIPEIVRHEHTGLLTENQPAAIAAAMSRLRGDRDLARKCAASAREMVAKRFTIDEMVRGTLRVYEQVLAC